MHNNGDSSEGLFKIENVQVQQSLLKQRSEAVDKGMVTEVQDGSRNRSSLEEMMIMDFLTN